MMNWISPSDCIQKTGRIIRPAALLLGLLFLLATSACDSSHPPQKEPENTAGTETALSKKTTGREQIENKQIIVAMGDSLTAGLGLAEAEAYPALLEQLLAERGHHYRVVNAGISGETSSGARSRIDWILKLKPRIVILETGANDGLRGIDPKLIEENIDHILTRLKQENVTVVLVGMQMVTNLGQDYVTSFNRLYPQLAARHQVVFMPFFLQGVATEISLNQADGIHPNSAGYEVIASNLLPYVEQAVEKVVGQAVDQVAGKP